MKRADEIIFDGAETSQGAGLPSSFAEIAQTKDVKYEIEKGNVKIKTNEESMCCINNETSNIVTNKMTMKRADEILSFDEEDTSFAPNMLWSSQAQPNEEIVSQDDNPSKETQIQSTDQIEETKMKKKDLEAGLSPSKSLHKRSESGDTVISSENETENSLICSEDELGSKSEKSYSFIYQHRRHILSVIILAFVIAIACILTSNKESSSNIIVGTFAGQENADVEPSPESLPSPEELDISPENENTSLGNENTPPGPDIKDPIPIPNPIPIPAPIPENMNDSSPGGGNLSVDDAAREKAHEIMLRQEDVQDLMKRKHSEMFEGTVMTVGDKIYQRYSILTVWLSLSFNQDPPSADECEWMTVICENGTVTELHMARQDGWNGVIPREIVHLKHLKYLDIAENRIKGTIPDVFYYLTNLEHIFLHDNQLRGTISDGIGNMEKLRKIYLSRNTFSGTFPQTMISTVGGIRPLRYLSLGYNQFYGSLPEVLNYPRLKLLDLSFNQFSGTIPTNMLDKCSRLRWLYLDYNKLQGKIPDEIVSAGTKKMETIYLSHNQLTGSFPSPHQWVKDNVKLNTIEIQNNYLKDMSGNVCDMSVFKHGEMVQLQADCDICKCDLLCQNCTSSG